MTLPAWYSKALSVVMVISGIGVTALAPYYGGRSWFDAVVASLAALGIHGTLYTPPSSPPAVTPPPAAAPPSSTAPLS